MEDILETVAKWVALVSNWAASASGSEMLKAVATTAVGILLATFIRTQTWPLTIFLAKGVRKMSCVLAGLAVKLVPKRIFKPTDVELEEHEEGTAPSQVQAKDV